MELLLSTAILGLLVVCIGQLFSSTSQSWMRGEGDAERRRGTRALTDFIGRELQEALLPVEIVKTGSGGNLQFIVNPPASQAPADYRNADCIFWQAPLARESTYGEIASIGYFVQWQGDMPVLCRFFVNPSVKNGTEIVRNPNFLVYDSDPDAWLSPAVLDAVVNPDDATQGYRGLFAEYVLGLWIECQGLDGRDLPRAYDSRAGYDCLVMVGTESEVTEKRYLPATVRVSIAQTSASQAETLAQAAAKVRGIVSEPEVRNAAGFLSRMREESSQDTAVAKLLPSVRVYTTKVKLKNAR